MKVRKVMNLVLTATLIACTAGAQMAAQSKSSSSSVTSVPATKVESASGYNQPPKSIWDGENPPPPANPGREPDPRHDSPDVVAGVPADFPRGDALLASRRRARRAKES